jgi:hypothetical protein
MNILIKNMINCIDYGIYQRRKYLVNGFYTCEKSANFQHKTNHNTHT